VIALSLTILGFATADLVRWSPDEASRSRAVAAFAMALLVTTGVGCLAGLTPIEVLLIETGSMISVLVWLLFDQGVLKDVGPRVRLAWILCVLVAAFALSGLASSVSGPLASWYSGLPFHFVASTSIDQALLGISAALFLLATSNRIVRLILAAAGTLGSTGEMTLAGGRLLGPMERLFVGAMVISGDLTAAAALIAAKGLLRLPEIRSSTERASGVADQVTEYVLIGTFSSLLVASVFGALVSASG